jgi:hypothetical protein
MSGDNRTTGPTNIYNLPHEAYERYAREQKNLEETQQKVGAQDSSMARGATQLMATTVMPSQMELLFGLERKAPLISVDAPPGYGTQMARIGGNGETIFGAPSHLSSLQATVQAMQAAPEEVAGVVDLLAITKEDLQSKNGVIARMASLRQG